MFVAKYFHHRIANCGLQAALYSDLGLAVQKKVISPLRRVPPLLPPTVRGVRGANINKVLIRENIAPRTRPVHPGV